MKSIFQPLKYIYFCNSRLKDHFNISKLKPFYKRLCEYYSHIYMQVSYENSFGVNIMG